MRNILIAILFTCTTGYGQTKVITQKKVDKIFLHFNHNKVAATDSVIQMLSHDKWFLTLLSRDEHFRIARINYYKTITIKRPKNSIYLKGWVKRALN